MVPQSHAGSSLITYLITGVVVLAVLAFRMARSRVARPLRIEYLWVVPAIYMLFGALSIWALAANFGLASDPANLAIMAACLVAGAAVGWWRGKLMKIDVHPETHVVMVQASAWAIGVILALLLVRLGLRYLFFQNVSPTSPAGTTMTVDFILAAVGILGVARLEMWLRASRLLAQARTAKASA
jgi:hypothetical protein